MLMSDTTHEAGPQDPFKLNKQKKPGVRIVSVKVTQVNHYDNTKLTNVIGPARDHKPQ